jgi:hypothetical protein
MEAANQALFDDAQEYQRLKAIASGFNGEKGEIIGGMSFITEDKVRSGDVIYRIGHSNKERAINISSPWWMRDAAFRHIMGASEAADSDPQELYRMKCAVSYDFGVADIVLQARVKQTLRCFTGRGRPVYEDKEKKQGRCFFGAVEIAQLFIPGLRDFKRQGPTPLCNASIEVIEEFKVGTFMRVQRRRTEDETARLDGNPESVVR